MLPLNHFRALTNLTKFVDRLMAQTVANGYCLNSKVVIGFGFGAVDHSRFGHQQKVENLLTMLASPPLAMPPSTPRQVTLLAVSVALASLA